MLLKISSNVQEDSGDLNMELFRKTLLIFITLLQNNGKKQLLSNYSERKMFYATTLN